MHQHLHRLHLSRHNRVTILVGILLTALLLAVLPVSASEHTVLVLEVEGPVTPAMAGYFERGVERAEEVDAEAVLIVLDTPGGAIDTTQAIIQLFRNADIPVIVFIAPAGAQAASAGSLITLAAHASGMAPETVIGAASPVGGSGEDIEETLYRKIVEDLKAQVRGIAERRGPEVVELAEAMIEEARAVNANEALEVGLVDVVATDVPDLLEQLDGLTVYVDDAPVVLETADAQQEPFGMSFIEQLLHALSNPLLVGILLTLGVQAILIELSSPGGWVAGFFGVLFLALAFYGLGTLPANWFGLGLVALAFVLFIFELQAPGVGGLALAGTVSLLAGLLVLFNTSGAPDFARLSLGSALAITALTSAFFLFVVAKVAGSQRRAAVTGKEGLIGQHGEVRKMFVAAPGQTASYSGMVLVGGELWRAVSQAPLENGAEIVVTGSEGITLLVEPAEVPQVLAAG